MSYSTINLRKNELIMTKWIELTLNLLLTLLLAPSHLFSNFHQVVFCDHATLIHVEQLKDLSVDVVTWELANVAFRFVGSAACVEVGARAVCTILRIIVIALRDGVLARD